MEKKAGGVRTATYTIAKYVDSQIDRTIYGYN
jgi:hypothetical protein